MATSAANVKGNAAPMASALPHSELRAALAEWVAQGLREHYGGNRTKLAKASEVSRETIWKILKGRGAKEETVEKLSLVLGTPPPLREAQQMAASTPGRPGARRSHPEAILPSVPGEGVAARVDRIAGVVARVVAQAIHNALADDEASKTRAGQKRIGLALSHLAAELSEQGFEVSGLIRVSDMLRDGQL
jgi:hypothetical protein